MRSAVLPFCVASLASFLAVAQGSRPVPTAQEQNVILENARDYVLRDTESASGLDVDLVQRRYSKTTAGSWQLQSVERVPGSPEKMAQFRTVLREPFEPASFTSFAWDHWGTLRGRPTYVFSYIVERTASVQLYSGLIYVDARQGTVLRITRKTADAPVTSRVREVSTILDYPLETVGVGRVVPFKAEEQVLSEDLSTKTVTEVILIPVRLRPVTNPAPSSW